MSNFNNLSGDEQARKVDRRGLRVKLMPVEKWNFHVRYVFTS
jgi:hypothetical protein